MPYDGLRVYELQRVPKYYTLTHIFCIDSNICIMEEFQLRADGPVTGWPFGLWWPHGVCRPIAPLCSCPNGCSRTRRPALVLPGQTGSSLVNKVIGQKILVINPNKQYTQRMCGAQAARLPVWDSIEKMGSTEKLQRFLTGAKV